MPTRIEPHRPAAGLAPRWALATLLVLASSVPSTLHAQDRDELQVWSALLGTASIEPAPPTLSFWLDVHIRRGGAGTVHITRPGVGISILDWLSVWAGYGYIPVFTDGVDDAFHEHRIWQQVIIGHGFPELGISFQSRTRFEQRFMDTPPGFAPTAGDDVGFRIREFVRFNWQPSPDVPIGVALWDELFIGLNETNWGAPAGIDQNRLFVGPFLKMAPYARLEAGYLFVYLDRGTTDTYAHVVAVNLFLSIEPPAPPADEGGGDGVTDPAVPPR